MPLSCGELSYTAAALHNERDCQQLFGFCSGIRTKSAQVIIRIVMCVGSRWCGDRGSVVMHP